MSIHKLNFRPGIHRDGTAYSNLGGWYDCDRVRFRKGAPEQIGGWAQNNARVHSGTCRSLNRFVDLSGNIYTALGTFNYYYVDNGTALTDVTPLRASLVDTSDPITTVNTESDVTITDVAHGAAVGDRVSISGADATGGIAAGTLNADFIITSVTDADNFKVETGTAATSSVTGGGTVTIKYHVMQTGVDEVNAASGFGDANTLGLWTQDNFGEDLVTCMRNVGLYYWDATSPTARMVHLSTLSGASNVPTVASRVLVSDNDRHVIAFACTPFGGGSQDHLLIRWSDQEDAADWDESSVTNTAGSFRLAKGSRIIAVHQTKQEILVFTDRALYSMQYIGGQFTFGRHLLAENTNIGGFNCVTGHGGTVYWMGPGGFYRYNGQVEQIPCSVEDYIINQDCNWDQFDKIYASTNTLYDEIIWFYPGSGATENDSYVVFNYAENVWYYGTMVNTAWLDNPFNSKTPLAAATDGYLYDHESGEDDNGSAIAAYVEGVLPLESVAGEVDDGSRYLFLDKIIHDFTFRGVSGSPAVKVTITGQRYPGKTTHDATVSTVTRSATSPVEQWTTHTNVRVRARQFLYKVETDTTGVSWRMGAPRVNIRTDGRQ